MQKNIRAVIRKPEKKSKLNLPIDLEAICRQEKDEAILEIV